MISTEISSGKLSKTIRNSVQNLLKHLPEAPPAYPEIAYKPPRGNNRTRKGSRLDGSKRESESEPVPMQSTRRAQVGRNRPTQSEEKWETAKWKRATRQAAKRKQESKERKRKQGNGNKKARNEKARNLKQGKARKEKARKHRKRTQGQGNHNSTAKIDVDLSANGIYNVHRNPMTCISIIPRI